MERTVQCVCPVITQSFFSKLLSRYADVMVDMERCLHDWPFMRGIHRWPVDSPCKGPVIESFDVSLLLAWMYCCTNSRFAGDFRRHVQTTHKHTHTSDGAMALVNTASGNGFLYHTITWINADFSLGDVLWNAPQTLKIAINNSEDIDPQNVFKNYKQTRPNPLGQWADTILRKLLLTKKWKHFYPSMDTFHTYLRPY